MQTSASAVSMTRRTNAFELFSILVDTYAIVRSVQESEMRFINIGGYSYYLEMKHIREKCSALFQVREFRVRDVLLYLIKEFIRVEDATGCEQATANLRMVKGYLKTELSYNLLMHTLGVMFKQLEVYLEDWNNMKAEFKTSAKLQLLLVNY